MAQEEAEVFPPRRRGGFYHGDKAEDLPPRNHNNMVTLLQVLTTC